MDPTQCYREMNETTHDGDGTTARERALSLQGWLTRGGFSPPGHSEAEVRAALADVLHRTAELADKEGGDQ